MIYADSNDSSHGLLARTSRTVSVALVFVLSLNLSSFSDEPMEKNSFDANVIAERINAIIDARDKLMATKWGKTVPGENTTIQDTRALFHQRKLQHSKEDLCWILQTGKQLLAEPEKRWDIIGRLNHAIGSAKASKDIVALLKAELSAPLQNSKSDQNGAVMTAISVLALQNSAKARTLVIECLSLTSDSHDPTILAVEPSPEGALLQRNIMAHARSAVLYNMDDAHLVEVLEHAASRYGSDSEEKADLDFALDIAHKILAGDPNPWGTVP
jgi:hypothetical protein